jgi:hypothetical protein
VLSSAPCNNCNCPVTVSLTPGRYYKSQTGCGYNKITAGCKMTGYT